MEIIKQISTSMFKKIKRKIKGALKYYKDFKKWRKEGGIVEVKVSYNTPNNRFAGHNVFVSGGSSGIGLAIAKAFLAEGASVIITGRKQEKLDAVRAELNSINLFTLQMDISDVSRIGEIIVEADKILPNIDIFINSAGVSDYAGNSMMQEETYDYIININQKGLFYNIQSQGEYLIQRGIQGKIINITSKAGERIAFDPYTLSKWGANSITKGAARWLAPYHISVNGIAPGRVPTTITAELESHINSGNDYTPRPATKRFTRPEEIAELTLFLSSNSAGNIIGQIINIDGGIYD